MAATIVFLHGFTHTARSWEPVIAGLRQSYSPVALDLRGHGSAWDRRPIGFAECVSDVAEQAPPAFALAGYSMGARIALHMALAHPARVERLVLIGGTAGIADPAEREERRAADLALADEIESGTIEEFARRWAAQPLFKGQAPAVAETAHADRLRNRPDGLAAALRGIGTGAMEPLWGRLAELRSPTTVVVGERDSKFRKLGERLVASLRDAELVVVPATGHAVHLEAPRVISELLRERIPATAEARSC